MISSAWKVSTPADLFTWQNFLPGIWTCFLFRESETYIRTDLMAGAEIYHRASGNSWAVSNDIDLLRLPTDCVDKSKVARSLLYPAPPFDQDADDLTGESSRLDPGAVYRIKSNGKLERVFQPTIEAVNRGDSEAIVRLRDSLRDSVLSTSQEALGADLSGGFDSTSLCYLLKEGGVGFKAFTGATHSSGGRDGDWAKIIGGKLQPREHIKWISTDLTLPFEPDPYTSTNVFAGRINAAKMRYGARQARRAGVTVVIGGHGGDELFDLDPSFLHESIKRRPLLSISLAREYGALERWQLSDTANALLPMQKWDNVIRAKAKASFGRPNELKQFPNRWMVGDWFIPPWITPSVANDLNNALLKSMLSNEPAKNWAQRHLTVVNASASSTKHIRNIYAEEGIELRTPYLDESVFRSMIAIPPEMIGRPTPPKEGLRLAMKGIVDPQVFERKDQDSGSPDVFLGWHRHRKALSMNIESWKLVKEGLVDRDELYKYLNKQVGHEIQPIAIARTIATEHAIRRLETFNEVH